MIRDALKAAQISAMKSGDKARTQTLRLITAKIKDREIELRTQGGVSDDDAMVTEVMQRMVKQRRESIAMFESGGRPEKAAEELAEIVVIEEFLPTQLSEDETNAIIAAIKDEVGATSIKDMGKVVAALKARHGSQLDMGKASALVKAALAG